MLCCHRQSRVMTPTRGEEATVGLENGDEGREGMVEAVGQGAEEAGALDNHSDKK